MPRYHYTGLNQSGARQTGEIDAPNENAALAALRERLITPLEIAEFKESRDVDDYIGFLQRVPYRELVIITRQLVTMINAGITVLGALAILEEQQDNKKLKAVLRQLVDDVESGESLADAFAKHPAYFDALYVSVVRAGENSGSLDEALDQLANQMERAYRLRRQVRAAVTYPLVVLVVAVIVLLFMLIFLVPTFVSAFADEGAELPGLTQQVMRASEVLLPPDDKLIPASLLGVIATLLGALGIAGFVRRMSGDGAGLAALGTTLLVGFALTYLYVAQLAGELGIRIFGRIIDFNSAFIGAPALAATPVRVVMIFLIVFLLLRLGRWLTSTDAGRRTWDRVKLNIPLGIGALIQKIAIARFSRTFASLQRAGVPILGIFAIVEDSAGNSLIADAVRDAAEEVAAGGEMSEPLAKANVFPPMVTRMIAVGEQTGTVDLMLEKIADFYEADVETSLKSLSSIIEPIMLILVGSLVGTIVIALYLPIFAYSEVLSQQAVTLGPLAFEGARRGLRRLRLRRS